MSKAAKVILGICSFLPLLFGIGFLVFYISLIIDMVRMGPGAENAPDVIMQFYFAHIFFGWLVLAGILALITWLSLLIYYILHAARNVKGEGEKVMWILLFIFLGSFCFPIYFFIRVLPMPYEK